MKPKQALELQKYEEFSVEKYTHMGHTEGWMSTANLNLQEYI